MGGMEGESKTDDEGLEAEVADAAEAGDKADGALHLEAAGAGVAAQAALKATLARTPETHNTPPAMTSTSSNSTHSPLQLFEGVDTYDGGLAQNAETASILAHLDRDSDTTMLSSTYFMMDNFDFGAMFPSDNDLGAYRPTAFDGFDSLESNFGKVPLLTPPSNSPFPLQDISCHQFSRDPKHLLKDRPQSCFTIALNILPSLLTDCPTTCTLSSTSLNQQNSFAIPTIDSVISNNKKIIEAISTMLPCPCSLDDHLATIISIIAFKVMTWYAAAARDIPLSDSSSSSSSISSESPTLPFEQVLYVPMTVGKYHLDGADHSRMRAQLVLSELHRVQRLVELLSKRLEGVRSRLDAMYRPNSSRADGPGNMNEAMSPMSASIFVQLEADLRKRLRAVSRETMNILHKG
ncbi:hypothetical protein LTR66_007681 [Elasticomyces elasticus]|nr:hypothetical protein LTR66_007681 [Elasticomyces elasticus]